MSSDVQGQVREKIKDYFELGPQEAIRRASIDFTQLKYKKFIKNQRQRQQNQENQRQNFVEINEQNAASYAKERMH